MPCRRRRPIGGAPNATWQEDAAEAGRAVKCSGCRRCVRLKRMGSEAARQSFTVCGLSAYKREDIVKGRGS